MTFTAIIALLGPLALPPSAVAAPAASPSPTGGAAPTASKARIIDLGPLNSNMGVVTAMNNKGEVAAAPWEPTNGGGRAALYSAGSVVDVHASLGADVRSSVAMDVNDDGTVVGTFDGRPSFLFKDGKATRIEPGLARAINNKGQVVGPDWIRDPDGSVLRLSAYKDQRVDASSLNERGQVAGGMDTNTDKYDKRYRAFRTRPGEPIDVKRDRLEYKDSTVAFDINDRGQVAGYGTDENGGYVPLIWDENGRAQPMDTPFGGMVDAINNTGIGVGRMYDKQGWLHAGLFENNVGIYLHTLVPGWTLKRATDINDLGQITGVGIPPGDSLDHAFLLDLGDADPVIHSLTFATQIYPSVEWVEVPEAETIDGNRVRVSVSIFNPGDRPVSTRLRLVEEVSGKVLPGGEIDEILDPRESVTEEVIWDTAGFAWHKGEVESRRKVTATLVAGGFVHSRLTESYEVRPKPVALVHGYMSDAQKAWGTYPALMKRVSPLLEGYAVGDGRIPGELHTGNASNPFERTRTLRDNAVQEAVYIEALRRGTGAFHVDVVAHSMGGLITRQYIQTEMPDSPDGKPVVSRMIQLGTPNRGSPCADRLMDLALWNYPIPFMPATQQVSVPYVDEIFNRKVADLKGVTASNLVGVGRPVPCYLPWQDAEDGDRYVPESSAQFTYTDIPYTQTAHTEMTESWQDFHDYVVPRLSSTLVNTGNPGGVESLRKGIAARSGTEAGADAASTFAAPSVKVEAGKTATVPLEVPAGTGFGVTGALPPTVGLLLRDPSGKPAAQYDAGSEDAEQPVQGLSVSRPTAGQWKLEITNTAAGPVEAALVAWVAGNPVKVAVESRQSSEDGRARVKATVTDDGKPVAGADVRAVLMDEDSGRHEVTLKDDGGSDDGAAGDGVYGAATDPLPDGGYSVGVRADTPAGMRTAQDAVKIQKLDTREFELELSAQPGGSVTASPAQNAYRAGTTVTVTATAEAGRIPLGWIVDGRERPPGTLTITMDRAHTVVAKFGSYTVTELGALPGYKADQTKAVALNDRGQVAATVESYIGHEDDRAVRWEAGVFTDLGGLSCEGSGKARCPSGATGINEAGDVSGWAHKWEDNGSWRHAVVYRGGSITDLHPGHDSSPNSGAADLNDSGQVFGWTDRWNRNADHVMWTNGTAKQLPATPPYGAYSALQGGSDRINGKGAVAGAYVTARDGIGIPVRWQPALFQNGVTTPLELPECEYQSGSAHDVNATGLVVGQATCSTREESTTRAFAWKDGQRTDLGQGIALAVNDHGLVAGFTGAPKTDIPTLWLDGRRYTLEDLLPLPKCAHQNDPCMTVTSLWDVNSSGQILARGVVSGESGREERSLLLTPSTARADLKVTHTVSSAEPGPGATVTWTSTVTNKGPDPATDVRLDVLVPPAAGTAACETSRGLCTALKGGGGFRNKVKVLEPGWSATVTVTATIPSGTAEGTELATRAGASSLAVTDPELGDNQAEATATVLHALNRSGINFADPVRVGATSAYPVEVTLTNRSGGSMPVTAVAVEGPFRQTNDCPVQLEPGHKCTMGVTFAPTQVGAASGKLTITTDGDQPSYVVTLYGQGIVANNAPVVETPDTTTPLRGEVGKPFTLSVPFTDADPTDTHTAVVEWGDESVVKAQVTPKTGGGGGTVTATRTFDEPFVGIAMIGVIDSKGDRTDSGGIAYVIDDEPAANTAPVVAAGGDVKLTVNEKLHRVVSFSDPDSTSWTAAVDYGDGAGPVPVTPDGQKITLEHEWATAGTYAVTVTVRDNGGLQTSANFTATVVPAQTPNQAPQVKLSGPGTITEGAAWTGEATVTDPDSAAWSASVDHGDGTGPQALPVEGEQLGLKHVFADDGERTVTVTVTDDKGATGTAQLKVQAANAAPEVKLEEPAAGTVVAVGAPIALKASFTDQGTADTHTATWTVDGQTVDAAVAEHEGKGTVTRTHTFTKAGRHLIAVTVTDDDGATTTVDTAGGDKAYVIVYDPAGSLVGAGVVASPGGSCKLSSACDRAGAAAFAVAAGYPRKTATPVGELSYQAPGFHLRDTACTVLAAGGGKAILRGNGRVNGTTDVTFEITAVDSGKPFDRTDQLRLRAWRKNGELVYDNQRTGPPPTVTGIIRISGRN
ncbi:PKD domain-containing protein [Nonomuraea bangladeshensis]